MSFNYMYNGGTDYVVESAVSGILMAYGIFIFVYGLISLAGYVLRAIGFYTIGKNQGDDNAWLAFIPIVRKYQQGQLAGNILLKTKSIKNTGILFVALPVVWGIVSYLISMIMGISVAGQIIRYGIMTSYNGYGTNLEDLIEGLLGFIIIYVILAAVYQVIYRLAVILVDKTIFEKYTTGNMPVIHAVCSAMVPLYEAIYVFLISRRIKSDEEKKHRMENTYYNVQGRGEFSAQGMYSQEMYNQGNTVNSENAMPQQGENMNTPERGAASMDEQEIMNEQTTENKISEE